MIKELLLRFADGNAGRRRLEEQLLRQAVVANDANVARALCDVAELAGFQPGSTLIEQDGADTDIYLLLVGQVSIEIHGREVATRTAGQHVGEMSLIDPSQRRSATVRAKVETIAARVPEDAFTALALAHPVMWRRLGLELGERLRQRGALVRPKNDRPEVFIGSCSSNEGLGIARAVQCALAHDPWTTRVWTDGTFGAGKTAIESLTAQINTLDFALLVVTPDDLVSTTTGDRPSPRDNVVFELGLMMGALGRERAFMVKTRCRPEDLRLPSDLVGVQALEVVPGDADALAARVGPPAEEFRGIVRRLWSR